MLILSHAKHSVAFCVLSADGVHDFILSVLIQIFTVLSPVI